MVEVKPENGVEEVEETEETGEQPQEEVAETSEPRKPSDEIKVVIIMKGSSAMIGVQSPDCDPIFTTLEGDLNNALSQVPALVESANAQWDANPHYPKAKMPEKPPSPAPSRREPAQTTSKPKQQPSFF